MTSFISFDLCYNSVWKIDKAFNVHSKSPSKKIKWLFYGQIIVRYKSAFQSGIIAYLASTEIPGEPNKVSLVYIQLTNQRPQLAVCKAGAADDTAMNSINYEIMQMEILCHIGPEENRTIGEIHPYIVKYYGCSEDRPMSRKYIFFEYMTAGSLYNYLYQDSYDQHIEDIKKIDSTYHPRAEAVSIERVYRFCLQIASALKWLHSINPPMLHRDLKSHNILLTRIRPSVSVAAICRHLLLH